MNPILPKIENKQLQIGNRAVSLLSGEVHYWRLDPHQWRTILERVKEMGIRLVATYICWDFHELAPGKFDFTGQTDPRRNLVGFIELLTELEFDIVLRPGPYIYAEWNNNGVPERVAHYHRLDPSFLKESEVYLSAVIKTIEPFFSTRGGRVVLLQAENEIDLWPSLFAEKIGIGKTQSVFTDFIREQFASIENYNNIHQTKVSNLEDIRPVCVDVPDRPAQLAAYLDYQRFKHWFTNKVASWAVGTYRKLGVDLPIYLNGYDGLGIQNWVDFGQIADFYGLDTYPTNEFSKWTDEFRFILEKGRYSRATSKLPYLAEYESGIWHGWHYDTQSLTPNHYRLAAISALLGGFTGWNWYMLVNRDNWYMSPINEWGRTRPELFEVFKQIVSLYKKIDPASLEHVCHVVVTGDPIQRAVVKTSEKFMKAIFAAGIDYQFFDLETGECKEPVIFYSGREWLGKESQQKLQNYVSNGGHLVFFGVVPGMDDRLQPTQFFPLPTVTGLLPKFNKLEIQIDDQTIKTELPWMEWFEKVDGQPITAKRLHPEGITAEELVYQHSLEVGQSYVIGYTLHQGAGKITYVGADPTPDLIMGCLKSFRVHIPVQADNSQWSTALYKKGSDYFLFVTNPTESDGATLIEITEGFEERSEWQIQDLVKESSFVRHSQEGKLSFAASLNRKDATVFQLCRIDRV